MPTPEELAVASNRLLTDYPRWMALWLACEILVSDDTVMADEPLANALLTFQDKLNDINHALVLS